MSALHRALASFMGARFFLRTRLRLAQLPGFPIGWPTSPIILPSVLSERDATRALQAPGR
eukprot:6112328-Pyramimonas_sp.AAC.1